MLSISQFGFHSGLSVSDQLLLTYVYVSFHLDRGSDVDVLHFDYSKAFDVVNHQVLMSELYLIGIRDPLLGWIRDFLTNRKMQVVVHHSSSYVSDVPSGVPQGSVLGPLLLLIYINHITAGLQNKSVLFADDLKSYLAVPSKKPNNYEAIVSLQTDITLLYHRSLSWGLSFSVNKCACIHFSGYNPSPDYVKFWEINPFLIKNVFVTWVFELISH